MSQRINASRRHRLTVALTATILMAAVPGCATGRSPDSTAPAAPQSEAAFAPAPERGPALQDVPAPEIQRDIVKTASMSLTAGDPVAVANRAVTLATDVGGRLDNRSENAGSSSGRAHVALTLRVPADRLDDTLDEFETLGTVQRVEVRAEDVTSQRVDLDARITALQTSVDRLLGIMRDADDPEALIRAEEALSQRQADLDSLRAQRAQLGEQIAYSTVDLSIDAERIGGPTPQYRGFWGQVQRGWDTLVSAASGAVMLFGLVLPWLAVCTVATLLIVGLIRWIGARTGPHSPTRQTGGQHGQLEGQGAAADQHQHEEGNPVTPPGP